MQKTAISRDWPLPSSKTHYLRY